MDNPDKRVIQNTHSSSTTVWKEKINADIYTQNNSLSKSSQAVEVAQTFQHKCYEQGRVEENNQIREREREREEKPPRNYTVKT